MCWTLGAGSFHRRSTSEEDALAHYSLVPVSAHRDSGLSVWCPHGAATRDDAPQPGGRGVRTGGTLARGTCLASCRHGLLNSPLGGQDACRHRRAHAVAAAPRPLFSIYFYRGVARVLVRNALRTDAAVLVAALLAHIAHRCRGLNDVRRHQERH